MRHDVTIMAIFMNSIFVPFVFTRALVTTTLSNY